MSHEADVKRRIVEDLKEHVIIPVKIDGLHRHWKCQKPGSWIDGFNIVTWPGYLCFCGDRGDYLFERSEDMVDFMRNHAMSHSYAASKLVAGKDSVYEWSEDLFNQACDERLTESEDEDADELAEKMEEIRDAYAEYNDIYDAIKAMHESRLWDEIPNCQQLTFQFLWALHAIQWFCDTVKGSP